MSSHLPPHLRISCFLMPSEPLTWGLSQTSALDFPLSTKTGCLGIPAAQPALYVFVLNPFTQVGFITSLDHVQLKTKHKKKKKKDKASCKEPNLPQTMFICHSQWSHRSGPPQFPLREEARLRELGKQTSQDLGKLHNLPHCCVPVYKLEIKHPPYEVVFSSASQIVGAE